MTKLRHFATTRAAATLIALVLALLPAAPVLANRALTYADRGALQHVSAIDLAAITGGGCGSCNDAGDDDEDEPEEHVKVGSPYWETYRTKLLSRSSTPGRLVIKVNNTSYVKSSSEQYGYTYKSSLSVGISGGYGSFVKASIGGEESISIHHETTLTVPPRMTSKVYIKYWTERILRYGRRFQNYRDGTREVLGTSSGPVTHVWTEKTIMTRPLD